MKDELAKTGERFVEYFLRLSRETDGRALFNYRLFCPDMDELGDLFAGSRNVLPSLGDAGAHVSQIIDADWATFTLKYWVKERAVYSLAEGIRTRTRARAGSGSASSSGCPRSAAVMYACQICAGRVPPVTPAIPCTSRIGFSPVE